MKLCTGFVLFSILGYISTYTENERNNNMALETALEFNDTDNNSADLKLLDNVEHFIARVKSLIKKSKHSDDRRDFGEPKIKITFTDFLQKLIAILNTYDNITTTHFFRILIDEMRKYHYRGCKFYELMENNEIRELLATKLEEIRGKTALDIRTYFNFLASILKEEMYMKPVKEFLDYINSLYRQDATDKFGKVLTSLENFKSKSKKTLTDLTKIIRNGIRSIIFDHYTNLNRNARLELKFKIETFCKQSKLFPTLHLSIPQKETDENKKPRKQNLITNTSERNGLLRQINSQRNGREYMKFEFREADIDRIRTLIKQSDNVTLVTDLPTNNEMHDEKRTNQYKVKYAKRRKPEAQSRVDKKNPGFTIEHNVMIDVIGPTIDGVASRKSIDTTTARIRQKTTMASIAKSTIRRLPVNRLHVFRRSSRRRHPASHQGMTIEVLDQGQMIEKPLRKSYNHMETEAVNDIVIKKLNNLERELKDVKSKLIEVIRPKQKYALQEEKDKYNKYKRFSEWKKLNSMKQDNIKLRADNEIEYKSEMIENVNYTSNIKKDKPLTNNYEINVRKQLENIPYKEEEKSTKLTLTENQNFKGKENKMRLVNGDRPEHLASPAVELKMLDGIDEWKEELGSDFKFKLTRAVTTTATRSLPESNTASTTTSTSAEKLTIANNLPTVKIFVPISLSAVTSQQQTIPQTSPTFLTKNNIGYLPVIEAAYKPLQIFSAPSNRLSSVRIPNNMAPNINNVVTTSSVTKPDVSVVQNDVNVTAADHTVSAAIVSTTSGRESEVIPSSPVLGFNETQIDDFLFGDPYKQRRI